MKNAYLRVFVLVLGFIALFSSVSEATSVSGTVYVKRNQAREIVGCIIDTGRVNAAGKKIGVPILLDENGKSIAQQCENQKVTLEGSVGSDKRFKATTWKVEKDMTYANEKYTPEPEPKEEEREKYKPAKKAPVKGKKTVKAGDDVDDDDYSDSEDSEDSSDKDDDSDKDNDSDNDSDSDSDTDSEDNEDDKDEDDTDDNDEKDEEESDEDSDDD